MDNGSEGMDSGDVKDSTTAGKSMQSKHDVSVTVSTTVEEPPLPVQVQFDKVSIEVVISNGGKCCGRGKEVQTKKILDDVSGVFGPGEAVAVMGPSGSGKTTMLNALTGVSKPTSGSITLNGQPFNSKTMRSVSSLVPQDDLLSHFLTVDESLMEATTFKTRLSPEERRAKVDHLIKQFHLEECAHVLVGHPEGRKGISGGQKRRLSVALELCGDPSLLFLDEPTSGLDAVSAMTLVKLLSSLAKKGCTVVATIHQPSAAAFFTFDKLCLLRSGFVCYFGPVSETEPMAWFESAGFPCPNLTNPADYMFEVLIDHADELRTKHITDGPPEGSVAFMKDLPPLPTTAKSPISRFQQFRTHLRRNRKQLFRDPALARLRVASACGVGLVIGILYYDMGTDQTGMNDRIALLLFTMMFLAIVNVIPVIVAILPELAVVRKEVRNKWYSPRAYIPAKVATEMPLLIFPPAIYLAIAGFMSNLTDSDNGARYFMMWLALVLEVSCAHAWGLLICGLAPSMEVAFLAAPGSIMPLAVLSGFFKNQQDMTWVFRWFTYINFLNYAWQAMAYAGFYDTEFTDPPITGEEVLEERLALSRSDAAGFWINVGVLVGFLVGFRLLGVWAISRKLTK